MLYLLLKPKISLINLLSKFLQSNQYEYSFWPQTKKINDIIESTTITVLDIRTFHIKSHKTATPQLFSPYQIGVLRGANLAPCG